MPVPVRVMSFVVPATRALPPLLLVVWLPMEVDDFFTVVVM